MIIPDSTGDEVTTIRWECEANVDQAALIRKGILHLKEYYGVTPGTDEGLYPTFTSLVESYPICDWASFLEEAVDDDDTFRVSPFEVLE